MDTCTCKIESLYFSLEINNIVNQLYFNINKIKLKIFKKS